MGFIGKKVTHRVWGNGVIIKHDHPHFIVKFASETKQYIYPTAFEAGMAFVDEEEQCQLQKILADKTGNHSKAMPTQTGIHSVSRKQSMSGLYMPTKEDRTNIVFKSNYCDGGCSKRHIGYMGVCSDEMIRYNIEESKYNSNAGSEIELRAG